MALLDTDSSGTDTIVPGSRAAVPLGAAGSIDCAQVIALQWCVSGMTPGTAVLIAADPRGAACGVVRRTGHGAATCLVMEGVKQVSVEAPSCTGVGGALRAMQASPSHPAVALLSPSSLHIAGLPGGGTLAHRTVPASSGALTACQWLDAGDWGAPGGAVVALAFRTEIWFLGWGEAEVAGMHAGGGWGEARLLRRVLPGAEGALRSLAAGGRWLFVASDQKVVLPRAGGAINAAFAGAKSSSQRGRASATSVTDGAYTAAGGDDGDGREGGAAGRADANCDGMIHIRASTSTSSALLSTYFGEEGGGRGVPRSLILPEVQAAAAAAAAAYTSGSFNLDDIAGGGVDLPNFAALHAITLRPEARPPSPRTPGGTAQHRPRLDPDGDSNDSGGGGGSGGGEQYVRLPMASARKLRFYDRADLAEVIAGHLEEKQALGEENARLMIELEVNSKPQTLNPKP